MNPSFLQTIQRLDARKSAAYETTPALITAEIAAFTCPAGLTAPLRVPVKPRSGAAEGWCYRNVADAVAAEGGRSVFGWLTWVSALTMTAEYHAVWMTPAGEVLDVTTKGDGEHFAVFGADPNAPADFLQRPPARRIRTYKGRSQIERARDAINCFTSKEMISKRKRAEASGQSLEAWVAARLPENDELELVVDRYLACSNDIESLLTPTEHGMMCSDLDHYDELNARKHRLWRRLDAIVAQRQMLGLFAPSTDQSRS